MKPNTIDWKGRSVLITGGTKGLGFETASLFAKQGANIYLSYRSDEMSAAAAVERLRAYGVGCEAFACDQSQDGAADRLFDWLSSHVVQLDAYIHNAAATAFKTLLETNPQNIDKTFNITIKSFLRATQRAVPMMKPGSAIVSVSGMDTLRAVPRHGLLGSAKSALQTMTAYLAHELAARGIQVNSVNPGFFESDSTRKYLGSAFNQISGQFAQSTPSQTPAKMEDIASVIYFLCNPQARWVVGQTIVVDGGFNFSMGGTP